MPAALPQPVNGAQSQSAEFQDTYRYSTFTGLATVESSGNNSTSYHGGGTSSSGGMTWNESESGGTSGSFDYENVFDFAGGKLVA